MDLMMERTEKTTEAMGMEGRQATLHQEASLTNQSAGMGCFNQSEGSY